MVRLVATTLLVVGAFMAPTLTSAPALACGVVYLPTNAKAELAAIKKALRQGKLAQADREKAAQLLARAQRANLSKAERAKSVGEAMKVLGLRRIFAGQACIDMKLPAAVS